MSKIKSKREGSCEPKKKLGVTPSPVIDSEASQNNLSSQELGSNTTETAINQDAHLQIKSSDNETGCVEQQFANSNHQNSIESPLAKDFEDNAQTQKERESVIPKDLSAVQHIENYSSSQQSPLTLESFSREIMLEFTYLRERIDKIQTSIDSLRDEITEIKAQKVTTNSTKALVDSKRKETQSSNSHQNKLVNKQTRGKKLDFNAVIYLQEHGEDKLQEELGKKTNDELTQIIRSEGIKIGKDLKTLGRESMIQEIILNAKRRLNHGSVFLKD
jgi:hypothetical protein